MQNRKPQTVTVMQRLANRRGVAEYCAKHQRIADKQRRPIQKATYWFSHNPQPQKTTATQSDGSGVDAKHPCADDRIRANKPAVGIKTAPLRDNADATIDHSTASGGSHMPSGEQRLRALG